MLTQKHYFVTGTDTHIGKTIVSAALLHQLNQTQDVRAVGIKPIAAGAYTSHDLLLNEDVECLKNFSRPLLSDKLHCTYLLRTPASPNIAAHHEATHIDLAPILQHYQQAAQQATHTIVEGVGGFCVPLNDELTTADLAQAFDLPIVLVIGIKLGCINHALLTIEAIQARGLHLAAWVANTIDPDFLYVEPTLETLKKFIHAPLLGHIPYLSTINSQIKIEEAASYLRLST